MKPNIVFVFADQMRGQAAGFAGDPNVRTPCLDELAAESVSFANAVSTCPVCSPARASLLTGRYPHQHGVFVNDVGLPRREASLARVLGAAGYRTAWIGKWHLDGEGRSAWIPPERRHGFETWRALECTHRYHRSFYYSGLSRRRYRWPGYDASAQAASAGDWIRKAAGRDPFCLFLSWGPPHNPYDDVPAEYLAMYDPDRLRLRPNVPPPEQRRARRDLAGYYAHISALDREIGRLRRVIRETGHGENTIFVFWSDHGDMLGSHGPGMKQRPWDESILVPLVVSFPGRLGRVGRRLQAPAGSVDIMPTLLGLCGIRVPEQAAGRDLTPLLEGAAAIPGEEGALFACYHPFADYSRRRGGRAYRGLRTAGHTYVRDLNGPWLLYDNRADPFQMRNLATGGPYRALRDRLDARLGRLLGAIGDDFAPGGEYLARWGYRVGPDGAVPYRE